MTRKSEERVFGDETCQKCENFTPIPLTDRYTDYDHTENFCDCDGSPGCVINENITDADYYRFLWHREIALREYWHHTYLLEEEKKETEIRRIEKLTAERVENKVARAVEKERKRRAETPCNDCDELRGKIHYLQGKVDAYEKALAKNSTDAYKLYLKQGGAILI